MSDVLSKKQLEEYLELMKNALIDSEEKGNVKNIDFISAESFYNHFKNLECNSEYTISDIMNIISDFIPLALKQESLDRFLDSCKMEDRENVLKAFLESSKAEFLQLIDYSKYDNSNWVEVCIIVESLRKQKLLD